MICRPGYPALKFPAPLFSVPAGMYAGGYFGTVSNLARSFYSGGQNANFMYDVKAGSTGSCNGYLCQAGPGFDGPTGNGSPRFGSSSTTCGGVSCSAPHICAQYGSSAACCPAGYSVWCGGSNCYQPGHHCSTTQTCQGGGICSSPNVCARWNNQDVCCPASSPVWCGVGSCHPSGYSCSAALESKLPAAVPVALSSARPTTSAGAAKAILIGNSSILLQ